MQNIISRISSWRITARKSIINNWYGAQAKMYKTSSTEIESILKKGFPTAIQIAVNDKSSGCGAMFEIFIESSEFKNLSVIKQHKMIYEALKDQIKVIHGLRIVTKTPN